MRLYQIILGVPDDCVPEDMEVTACLPNEHICLISEGFITDPIVTLDKEINSTDVEKEVE